MEISSAGSEAAVTQGTSASTGTAGTGSASVSTSAVSGSGGTVDTFEASWQFESTVYSLSEVGLGASLGGVAADAELLELIIGLMLLEYLLGEGGGGGASSLLEMALMASILGGAGGEDGAAAEMLGGSPDAATGGEADPSVDPAEGGTLDVTA